MALDLLRLSLMAFPQRWDGANLSLNVLLIPRGNPMAALTPTWPQFAGTQLRLQAALIQSLASLPKPSLPVTAFPLNTTPPPNAAALFNALKPPSATIVNKPKRSLANVVIKKALPDSYVNAFPFEQPRNPAFFSRTGDYGCSVRAKDPGATVPPPAPETTWGELISYALRQPVLARALGLLYPVNLAIDPASLKDGGWIYITLDTSNTTFPYVQDWVSNPDFIKRYAARIPPLTSPRQLFAAALFPVVEVLPNESLYDVAQIEAEEYDDGFAKVVHCNQPVSTDAAVGDNDQVPPGTDAGIQIGWDDEQVAIWHNRQLQTALSTQVPVPDAIEAPLGVLGYRVDVRVAGTSKWNSLCHVKGVLKTGATFDMDQPLEPMPIRSQQVSDIELWLPQYFAQWRGQSLAVNDASAYQLTGGAKPLAPTIANPVLPPGLNLTYEKTYEFRTRLADLSGGGPSPDDAGQNAAPAPVGSCPFRRFIPPKQVRTQQPSAAQIAVWRPLVGYPEFLFTGVTDPAVVQKLISLVPVVQAMPAPRPVLGVSDRDVTRLRIVVEAKAPAHDTGKPGEDNGDLDGPYRVIYQFERNFPALKPLNLNSLDPRTPLDPAEAVNLNLVFQDVARIRNLSAPAVTNPQPIPVPRGRDVRIRLIPVGKNTPEYFGTDASRIGLTTNISIRQESQSEAGLFAPSLDVKRLNGIFLQPATDMAQKLAQQLDLDVNGLTFSGRPGRRVVFGASKKLRHTLPGDHSEITFAAQTELLNHWVMAIQLDLDRDWTWDALADQSFTVIRDLDGVDTIGTIEVRQTVSEGAAAVPLIPDPNQREVTHLVFFDAVDPNPAAGQLPKVLTPKYTVTPRFKGSLSGGPLAWSLPVTLPVAANPQQTPQIASAGIALSPYQPDAIYSSTSVRQRSLWLEFTEPPLDPNDIYFARVLAYGVDPLLTGFGAVLGTPNPIEPDLPIDPEPIRIITHGQSADEAGLDAMTQLIPSTTSNRHFLLPLPQGIGEDALELFGFWTYELRVGHFKEWSTAHGRFGRPLRVTGVQHPAPPLACMVHRQKDSILVSAPFATPVRDGERLSNRRGGPQTRMWVLLYAQVLQADGQSFRNVLLNPAPAPPQFGQQPEFAASKTRDVFGLATFLEKDIEAALKSVALPVNSPLSVLAVELLPAGVSFPNNPVSSGLGQERILRASPLTPVPAIC